MGGTVKKEAGDRGESFTAEYLQEMGYTVLARQWRCRYGEIDLIAADPQGTLCFVEVKLRRSTSIALPREFVDRHKQERLRKSAAMYLQDTDAPARFDVAEVYQQANGTLRIHYLENAFE